jgi:phosphoglycerol transferase MdoB-like AlkP superfamily enzyme
VKRKTFYAAAKEKRTFLSAAQSASGRFFPRAGALNIFSSILCLGFSSAFIAAGDVPGFAIEISTAGRIVFALLSVNVLSFVIEAVSFNLPWLKRTLSLASITLLTGMMSYHLASKGIVDPSLVSDNIALLNSFESFRVVFSIFGAPLLLMWTAAAALAFFLELKFRLFSKTRQNAPLLPKALVSIALFVIISALPFPQDELTLYMKQAFLRGTEASANIPVDREFPYIRKFAQKKSSVLSIPDAMRKPNIIIIMVESFNANFVEAQSPERQTYTPVFNTLIGKGLYIEKFYGNSVQTCKGQEAVLFSILPSSSGKIFVNYPHTAMLGFPTVLSRSGYRTVFFQGYHDLAFDNTRDGMNRAGFDTIKTFNDLARPEDRKYVWGWGAEDHIFYKRFFDLLDIEHKKTPGQPVFAALATIGTHIPCDEMPADRAKLYKEPANLKQKYANALHLSDAAFSDFFAMLNSRPWMKNTVVIITGDHSFPMREHGIYNNEICSYEESFRIPFLMIWDGVITPERVRELPYSQMDIAPSVLQLAGAAEGEFPFQGISIFDRTASHPVYLVQPYNGTFFEVIRYPKKYVLHKSTGDEKLFDLSTDPAEQTNLFPANAEENRRFFAKDIDYFLTNQAMIENNRIWKEKE